MRQLLQKDRFLLLAIIALTLIIALPVLTYPLGRDQGEFATIGRGLLDGRVPYRDLWNPKPPAVFYVYGLAMTFLGRTAIALRAIDFFIVPVICWALYALGKRVANRRVGLWAALLFPVFYFTETFWTLTQNDGIVLLPMVLGMVCVFKAAEMRPRDPDFLRPRYGTFIWSFLAGALGAYTVWFKYPFALFIGVEIVAYLLLYSATFTPTSNKLSILLPLPFLYPSAIIGFLLGLLVIGGGGILYLNSIGAWTDLLQSAQVTSQYTALTFNLQDFGALMVIALGFRWSQWGILIVLAGGWLVVVWLRGKAHGAGWIIVVLWLLVALAIMLVQAKAYDYHWLPMLPPLVLLAAAGLDAVTNFFTSRLTPPLHRMERGTLSGDECPPNGLRGEVLTEQKSPSTLHVALSTAFLLILALSIWPKTFPYLTGQEDQITYYSHFQAGEFIADESIQVANYLRERVVPGDSLFIWGFRPEVYYLSQLNPAVRFIFQFPLVGSWYPSEWREEAVDNLWAAMPPYTLVLQVDYMPWVTGSHDDSNTLLQGYTEMNNWLIANYERETQIGNFFIWRRKP
jgi:hypothetical protein